MEFKNERFSERIFAYVTPSDLEYLESLCDDFNASLSSVLRMILLYYKKRHGGL